MNALSGEISFEKIRLVLSQAARCQHLMGRQTLGRHSKTDGRNPNLRRSERSIYRQRQLGFWSPAEQSGRERVGTSILRDRSPSHFWSKRRRASTSFLTQLPWHSLARSVSSRQWSPPGTQITFANCLKPMSTYWPFELVVAFEKAITCLVGSATGQLKRQPSEWK